MRAMTWMRCVNLSLRLSLFVPIATVVLSGCSQKSDAKEDVDNGQTGNKGDKGDPGPQGPIGQPGPQGSPGEKGDKGDKGDTGVAGAKGDKGDSGLPGAKGDPGNPGMPGAPGMTGATGATGAAGAPGVPGAPGAAGMTGAKGDKGDKGNPGAVGPAGTGGSVTEDIPSFAGYTSMTYTGRVTGGRVGMHALCATAFTGSHLCHAAEYIQATSSDQPPAAGAWIDASTTSGTTIANNGSVKAGRYLGSSSCSSWNNTGGGDYGTTVNAIGTIDVYGDCSTARPLACCNTPTKPRFAGFTTATTTGAAGGRWKMHALCTAAFTGSHMCHGSEYIRTNSAATVPSGGAWLESSTITGTSVANTGVPESARYIGGYSCSSWNNSGGADYGTVLTEIGSVDVFGDCGKAHAVACCL